MSDEARRKYKADLEMRRIRDSLELSVDVDDTFDEVYETFSVMEKAVFTLKEYGFTNKWIFCHLEISHPTFYRTLERIRRKILKHNLIGG